MKSEEEQFDPHSSSFIEAKLQSEVLSVEQRSDLESHLEWIQGGFAYSPEALAIRFKEAASICRFELEPESGWVQLAFDLSFILGELETAIPYRERGSSKLAKRALLLSEKAEKLRGDLFLLMNNIGKTEGDSQPLIEQMRSLGQMPKQLKAIAFEVSNRRTSKKWHASELRHLRIQFAKKLSPLFEREFSLPAKPLGGSASVSLPEENQWACFYQAMAFELFDERVTPDRRAVLWEGYRLFQNEDSA